MDIACGEQKEVMNVKEYLHEEEKRITVQDFLLSEELLGGDCHLMMT